MSGRGEDINRVGVKPDEEVRYPVDDLAAGKDPQLTSALTMLRSGAAGEPASATVQPGATAEPSSGGAPDILKPIGPARSGGNPAIPILK